MDDEEVQAAGPTVKMDEFSWHNERYLTQQEKVAAIATAGGGQVE